jgi:hypothetical protein
MAPETTAVGRATPELVQRIALGLDRDRLHAEATELVGRVPMIFEGTTQLALQIRPGTTDPWYESCYQEKDIAPEREYRVLNPELAGTYFEYVLEAFPFDVCRARLMGLESRFCYSVHRDETARYHIAIDTSEHALFIFVEKNEVVRIPPDGDAYFVDTREVHTAMNGARNTRLHLVVGAVR